MAKENIKSEKITPFGGIHYASKAFYTLSLDKVFNGTLGVRSSSIKKFVFHFTAVCAKWTISVEPKISQLYAKQIKMFVF